MGGVAELSGAAVRSVADLRGDPRRQRRERVVRGLFLAAAAFSLVVSALIVLSLVGRAVTFLFAVDPGALFSGGWFPRRGQFDLASIVGGTLMISVIAMAVAAPLGLGAAIYLSEYAGRRSRRILKPAVELMAGIPSVVMGFFVLQVISPDLVQNVFATAGLFNLLAAGIGVGLLVTPIVASIAEDSMHAVPDALREASYGLGSRRRTTSVRIVFPAAISGIVAALIVGLARAIGETMVVAMAAGGTGGGSFTLNPLDAGQTMTGAMTALATGSDRVKGAGNTFEALFFVGLLLFAFTLGLNVLSERFVRRVRRRY